MRVLPRLLAPLAVAACAVALAACGGDEISEVTCGELGLGGPGSDQQQNEEKLDEIESQIADEAGGDRDAAEVSASGALIGICVREDDPSHKPGDEALEVVKEGS
jgi:hypothetical protein